MGTEWRLFVYPPSKPISGMYSVLAPGWDCPCPSVVIQWRRQTWIPCQAGHSPGVKEQQRGTLPLPRGPRGESPCTLLLLHTQAHHICLPSTSGNFPLHHSTTASTLVQTSSSYFCFTATVAYWFFYLQYRPSNPFLHQTRVT